MPQEAHALQADSGPHLLTLEKSQHSNKDSIAKNKYSINVSKILKKEQV